MDEYVWIIRFVIKKINNLKHFISILNITNINLIKLQVKISNSEIQKSLEHCEYVGDFLRITTQFLFAVQIHSKGLELTPENSAVFRFYFITRNLKEIEKKFQDKNYFF